MHKQKARKNWRVKSVKFKDINIEIVSKSMFARIIGMTPRKVEDWLSRGIFLPPTFKDEANPVTNWEGEKVPRKYYLYREAISIRGILRGHEFKRRKPIPEELIARIHEVMQDIRDRLKNEHQSLLDYPIVLEFKNGEELYEWLSTKCEQYVNKDGIVDIKQMSTDIYKSGDKLNFEGGCNASEDS